MVTLAIFTRSQMGPSNEKPRLSVRLVFREERLQPHETYVAPATRARGRETEGTIDGIGVPPKTPERERHMEYTDVLFTFHAPMWYSTRRFPSRLTWKRFEDLKP